MRQWSIFMSFDLGLKNGDLQIQNGDLAKKVDSDKLIQSILKICLTPLGSNIFHNWYGSPINRNLIGSSLDTGILVQVAQSQLLSTLENLKNLQIAQTKSFQRVSADEQISSILGVSVVKNAIDPRLFDIRIKVLTKGLKPIQTTFRVSPL
jgi:phage baseplate assembly protein W